MGVNSDLVERFCDKFKGRYLTVRSFKNLNKRERYFHLFNHWNILHGDEGNIYHSHLNGATGEIEKTFSKIPFSELGKIVFVKRNDSFILFKRSKGMLQPEFVYTELRTIQEIDDKRIWLHENGVQIRRKYWELNERGLMEWKMQDAITCEKINVF